MTQCGAVLCFHVAASIISIILLTTSMSLVPVLVELPQYAHSFSVEVDSASSVLQVKEQIAQACPGRPRVEGQRLISKGRVLADAERIEQLWLVSQVV